MLHLQGATSQTQGAHDRLAWSGAIVIAPYRTRIGIQFGEPWLEREARARLLPTWHEESTDEPVDVLFSLHASDDGLTLQQNFQVICKLSDRDAVLREFEGGLHIAVGATAQERTFLHAGVVGWRGKALLLPGRSRAGKSSLVQALVAEGGDYYSDDLAALDIDGKVYPYPKPLSMRRGAWDSEKTPAEELGWRADLPPLPVGAVVALRFDAPESDLSLERLSVGEAVFMMLENCISIRQFAERDMSCLAKLSATAACFQGKRGEAGGAARELIATLGESWRGSQGEEAERAGPAFY